MVQEGQALRNKIIQEKYDNGDPLTTKTTTSRYVLYPDIFNPNNQKEAIIGEVWLNQGCRCTFRRLGIVMKNSLLQQHTRKGEFNFVLDVTYIGRNQRQSTISLHYEVAVCLWRIFINLRGIIWVMPRKITQVLDCCSIE
ncbi:hypothetical protein H5410_053127 [Solanum commersonii]|uniref:Uncharacterized protein n=1 Tax=Solanum commersonii TaxID=4109 RepID=A0A9J5X5E1_SOLCO|nr:hypothetical protein H5410_053127 [Solanum commersonii]